MNFPVSQAEFDSSWQNFAIVGSEVSKFVQSYFHTLQARPVSGQVEPGYLRKILCSEAPTIGEPLKSILNDFQTFISPGLTHWQHPGFMGWFPACTSPPSLIGDTLAGMRFC